MRKFLSVVAAGSLLAGCANETPDNGFDGPAVDMQFAALNLTGVGDVVWDIQVVNADTETVWEARIASSQYGDGAGSASYVGPCDADTTGITNGVCDTVTTNLCTAPSTMVGRACTADADCNANENTVNVWVVGVYDDAVQDAGAFEATHAAGVTPGTANAVPFQNPTTAADPLEQVAACLENQDAFVQFDVALMRPAQQGFFDIAVNFNNIFCSAKFDCGYETAAVAGDCNTGACVNGTVLDQPNTTCADETDCVNLERINLLHDASGRNTTFILGFACTAGADSVGQDNKTTELYLDDLAMTCGASGSEVNYWVETANHDTGGAIDGNLCTAGWGTTPDTCPSIFSDAAKTTLSQDAENYLYQVAVYSGAEQLTTDGTTSYNKAYWNIALGVKDAAFAPTTACTLLANATADDEQNTGDNVNDGIIAAGTVYPYITFNVDFATCGAEPLMFETAGAMVSTNYSTTGGAQVVFDNQSN